MESIKEQIFKMSEQELRDVNHLICARIKNMQEEKEISSSRSFATGDKVSFICSKKRNRGEEHKERITIIIDKITGTKIFGHEDRQFEQFQPKWSVPPSMCRKEA